MKKIFFYLLFSFAVIVSLNAQTNSASQNSMNKSLLRHVVMFGWKAGTDSASIQTVVDSFRALPGKINLIKQFEWGTNNSPEKLNQGLTHCFFLTFDSEKDRDAYLVHPAHKAFVDMPKPGIDKITVLDYLVQK